MTEIATTKPVLTRAQKFANAIAVLTKRIAADTAKLAETQLALDTSERLASVGAGTAIVARLGRAGSAAVEYVAPVAAVFDDASNLITPAVVEVQAKAATAGTLREVAARVLGTKEEDDGSLRYKIVFGEGVDTDVEVIQATQIVRIIEEGVTAADAANVTA